MRFWTIGYGNRKPGEFVEVLKNAGITAICDIRREPNRAWSYSYTANGLRKMLADNDIHYYWLQELGNPSRDNVTDFQQLMEAEAETRLARLLELDEPAICILCAELDVDRCHRRVVAEHLAQRGREVIHL